MVEFAKGVNVKSVKTKYGEIIKIGINYEQLGENPINEKGYINIDLKTGKDSGTWYASVDEYKKEG